MKKAIFALVIMVLVAMALPVFAQEFPDVPADHWAYQAVQDLVKAGIIQGYPDGTYGGKRAMSRYEFAQAIAKAIPVIEQQILCKIPPPQTCPPVDLSGLATKAELANYATKDQLAALQKLVDEFRDELAALGVDVEALRRDVAALNERVTALEAEVARVRFSGVGDVMGRGEVRNTAVPTFDCDNRTLSTLNPTAADRANPLSNSAEFNNFGFGLKAKAGEGANLNALINAGSYMNFALTRNGNLAFVPPAVNAGLADFLLWNLNADVALKFGSASAMQIVAGRQSFQLTPLTLKFVDPDSYFNVSVLDNGDFVFDGIRASFNLSKVALTLFADKAAVIGPSSTGNGNLASPNLPFGPSPAGIGVSQIGGARAVIGTPLNGNLGLTWYEAGLGSAVGRTSIFGADLNLSLGKLGVSGEYDQNSPNSQAKGAIAPTLGADIGVNNAAWNANLAYVWGKLGIGGGYTSVDSNYMAPGDWLRVCRAVDLRNVQGANANLSYTLGNNLSLVAEGQFLQPKGSAVIFGRTPVDQGGTAVTALGLHQLTYWRAGLRYGLTSSNSVDLGWEQNTWSPTGVGGDTTEQFVSIGLGHTFNANSSLKLLYQIIDYAAGGVSPYTGAVNADNRGGVAAAQFELKY